MLQQIKTKCGLHILNPIGTASYFHVHLSLSGGGHPMSPSAVQKPVEIRSFDFKSHPCICFIFKILPEISNPLNFPKKKHKTHLRKPPLFKWFKSHPLPAQFQAREADGSSRCIKSRESIDPENPDPAVDVDPAPFLSVIRKKCHPVHAKKAPWRFDFFRNPGEKTQLI